MNNLHRLKPLTPAVAFCRSIAFVVLILPIVALPNTSWSAPARIDATRLAALDNLMSQAIEEGNCPGGVVLVGLRDEIVFHKAYGHRELEPEKAETTLDTVYDLASLTKVVAAATSMMILIDRGQVSLSDRVTKFVPEFEPNGKDRITIEHLLTHRSGLLPDNPLSDYADGPAEAMRRIYALDLRAEPGEEFIYTDVGYIMLGEIVHRVTGTTLDAFARREIFEPTGMTHTTYNPPEASHARCAVQEKRDGEWIIGAVHDPRAFALGGVAGHAGLFSTADDLARYCRMILHGGRIDERRILSPLAVREMTRPRPDGATSGVRGLGFDVATGYSSTRGDFFDRYASFGHSGFTGTSLWIDSTTGVYVIILTNRLHPEGKGNVIDLRRKVATVVASAVVTNAFGRPATPGPFARSAQQRPSSAPAKDAEVLTGLDVLVRGNFELLKGQKVGVITNHTGLTRDGQSIVSLMHASPDVELVALFAPEHGFKGILDRKIENDKDPLTGLTVYSLYGETRSPTPEMLEGVDTLVFDIQDIGARFYTYIATMGNAMKAAADRGIRFVVLDRPNPITGEYVAGPLADADKLGFTAFYELPVAHGMTAGELATLFNKEMSVGADLTVVKMENWSRGLWYDQTGLLWVNPSPNMRNLTQAILYPGVCLIEACNISVGRGTDEPFEQFGAPWIDGQKLASALNGSGLAGVRFVPIAFTPTASKFSGEACGGVHVLVTDREAIDAVRVGMTIIWHLNRLFGEAFQYDKVNNLLRNDQALAALRQARNPRAVERLWRSDLARFKKMRARYLLYP